ncbi:MAG: GNAT family N-acetyltransferase [Alphaproteobacteria bacterium]|nr:GNAT family N-acetyltransferase [Alphaproteobacteria bacterium]
MSAGFILLAYDVAHLPELTDLWVSAWSDAMPAIDFEARRGWFVDHLTAMHDRGVQVTCAFNSANGQMAGFITLDKSSGHIEQLAVAPAYWSKGVAGLLVAHAKSASPRGLRLEVNQDNPRAVRFYEKHGFHRRAAGTNPGSGLKTWRCEWKP